MLSFQIRFSTESIFFPDIKPLLRIFQLYFSTEMTRNETHWAKCLHHKEYYCIDGKLKFYITLIGKFPG